MRKSAQRLARVLDVTTSTDAVRVGARFAMSFQRTLRIPDDGRAYPLPPGLGRLPILRVADYLDRVPRAWRDCGGVFIPMYQREALWLGFHAAAWKPNAVKIAVGKVNAISGKPDDKLLHADHQDYVVCPDQPWLDGIHTAHESIRQFVAMPLRLGYTVEASVTGGENFGGIQVTVFEPLPGTFPDEPPIKADSGLVRSAMPKTGGITSMGLGAGGEIRQKIYSDRYGIQVWDQHNYGQIFIHIINSLQFSEITGLEPPPTPINAKTYTEYGLPWFDLYDEAKGSVAPSERFGKVKTISDRDIELGNTVQADVSFEVSETQIKKLGKTTGR